MTMPCNWFWLALYFLVEAARAGYGSIPLAGTKREFPTPMGVFFDENLMRLLDVGACINRSDTFISYVPTLDGTVPADNLCQDSYGMKFVLYDLQLVELKSVDPVTGFFRAEFQMIFHWMDYIDEGSSLYDNSKSCAFLCYGNTSQYGLCCDEVWVPPIRLPGCDLNGLQSSSPSPPSYIIKGDQSLSLQECIDATKGANPEFNCFWRRLRYLKVDANCSSQMDLRNFPFDVQHLSIDILNPYASRTWFQLTKGFLPPKVDDGYINNIRKLSPGANKPVWHVKSVMVSGTCGITQTWQDTFFTQDSLLMELSSSSAAYVSQHQAIVDAFSQDALTCGEVEDVLINSHGWSAAAANALELEMYGNVRDKIYAERLNSTLQSYYECVDDNGKDFSWDKSMYSSDFVKIVNSSTASSFSTSEQNIIRTFNVLNLSKNVATTKLWLPCAVKAVANLTTPGIRVTILVQRRSMPFVVMLILPTIACVAFGFKAFRVPPQELKLRVGFVEISLATLITMQQMDMVRDMQPSTYVAPYTIIVLISHPVLTLIAFESLWVQRMCSRRAAVPFSSEISVVYDDAPTSNNGDATTSRDVDPSSSLSRSRLSNANANELSNANATSDTTDSDINHPSPSNEANNRDFNHADLEDTSLRLVIAAQNVDRKFKWAVGSLYIVIVLFCICLAYINGQRQATQAKHKAVSI